MVLILLTFVVLAIVLVGIVPRENEPSFEGRQLSDWLAEYGGRGGRNPSPAERQKPAEAIRQIGTNALPCLLTWLDYEPAAWRYKIGAISQKLPDWVLQSRPVRSLLTTDKAGERADQAMRGFRALGLIAAPALPELTRRINLTNSPATSGRALFALSSIGPAGLPAMMGIVSNLNNTDSLLVATCIKNMGTNSRPLVPILINALQDTNWFTAMIAAKTLGDLKFDPDLVVPALTKCLRDPRYELRMEVPLALMRFGELARSALPSLSNALNDPNPDVRANSARAIGQIVPPAGADSVPP
jgi:hypothetical protein